METKQRMARKVATTNKRQAAPKGCCNKPAKRGSKSRTDTPDRSRGPKRPPRQKSKTSHGPKGHVNKQKCRAATKAAMTNDSVALRQRGRDDKTRHCAARTAAQTKQGRFDKCQRRAAPKRPRRQEQLRTARTAAQTKLYCLTVPKGRADETKLLNGPKRLR